MKQSKFSQTETIYAVKQGILISFKAGSLADSNSKMMILSHF